VAPRGGGCQGRWPGKETNWRWVLLKKELQDWLVLEQNKIQL